MPSITLKDMVLTLYGAFVRSRRRQVVARSLGCQGTTLYWSLPVLLKVHTVVSAFTLFSSSDYKGVSLD
jgi:hypothetical protein